MTQQTGTFDVTALVRTNLTPIGSLTDSQLQALATAIAADTAAYSGVVTDMLGLMVETTQDRQRTIGSSLSGNMMEVDEYGRGPTQKALPGYLAGFPLRKFQYAVGFTTQWLRNATVADLAIRNEAAQQADMRRLRYEIAKAIFGSSNYTFVDHLTDNASLAVKALINADSSAMQNGPNGETFDGSTHTHYDGIGALTAAALQATINDVIEHRNGAQVQVHISVLDVTTVTGLAGFIALQPPYVTLNQAANQPTVRLAIDRPDNRLIGYFGGAEVWTKPWVPQNYLYAVDTAAPQKPLVRRVEANSRGLFLAANIKVHPLEADYIENYYGFGCYGRTAIAVLKFNNASYSDPVLTY